MSHILACIVPSPGHINPMLAVAQHLKTAGHEVTILTGDVFKDKVVAAGLDFVPVTGVANFDYRRPEDFFPDKRDLRGLDLIIHYFKHPFGDTIREQDRCIRQVMARKAVDLILMDVPYLGTFPLLLGPKDKRPPIVGCGVLPLVIRVLILGPARSQIQPLKDYVQTRKRTASSRRLYNQPLTTSIQFSRLVERPPCRGFS